MIDIKNLKPFPRFCCSIGYIPTSYKISMTYEEQLLWLCDFLENTVIPTVNQNGQAVEELQTLYEELRTYVNSYFDSQNLQPLINNKLDEMVENGTLENIIAKYINDDLLIIVDNVNDLKNLNLKINQNVKTLGYYNIGDGGSSIYKIKENSTNYYETLNNGLVAELILNNEINVKQFGVYGNGQNNDTVAIKNAIASLKFGDTLNFNENETYLIDETIYLPKGANYNGNNCNFNMTNFENNQFIFEYGLSNIQPSYNEGFIDYYIKNISIINNNNLNINGFHLKQDVTISNIYTWGLDRTIEVYDNYIDFVKISDINVRGKRGNNYAIDTGYLGDSRELRRLHFHKQSMISENPNMLYVGSGHNSCIIESYINGNINIVGSNVNIKNAHIEKGNIIADNCELTIESAYIYKFPNLKPIVLTNSNVILSNILISYRTDNNHNNDDCIDVNFDNSTSLKINNVYKIMQGEIISFKHKAGILTNNNNFNINMLNNSIDSLTRDYTKTNYLVESPNFNGNLLGVMYTDSNIKWKQNNGTYYYRALLLYDKERLIGYTSGSNVLTANVTLGGNAPFIALNGRINSDIRLYRGTTNNVYTEYVDTSTLSNRIIDDGVLCNGNKWVPNTNGEVTPVLYAYAYEKINKNNVRVYANSIPSQGTWKKGDIIIKSNPIPNNAYGWICVEDGTSGTWKEITTISN